jgi:hypothetical protein
MYRKSNDQKPTQLPRFAQCTKDRFVISPVSNKAPLKESKFEDEFNLTPRPKPVEINAVNPSDS